MIKAAVVIGLAARERERKREGGGVLFKSSSEGRAGPSRRYGDRVPLFDSTAATVSTDERNPRTQRMMRGAARRDR